MDEFEVSAIINRSIEQSFTVLANLKNDAKWRTEWVEIRNMSGESLAIGAKFLLVGELLGRRIETVYEVAEYEPNHVAAWNTVSGPLQLKFWRTLESVDGGTRFAVRYEGEAHGFLKLAWPLITRMARRQHESDIGNLKELMEARAL